jgi:hypothetical protein
MQAIRGSASSKESSQNQPARAAAAHRSDPVKKKRERSGSHPAPPASRPPAIACTAGPRRERMLTLAAWPTAFAELPLPGKKKTAGPRRAVLTSRQAMPHARSAVAPTAPQRQPQQSPIHNAAMLPSAGVEPVHAPRVRFRALLRHPDTRSWGGGVNAPAPHATGPEQSVAR